ncbi:MAG TPA: DUF2442 domain-containing protein [Candidatus Kapabacteria bacterium]|nr:DUF2442 domain-containing protein [Candidatus Kapabacteria bacterium]
MRIIHDMKPVEGPFIDVDEAEYLKEYRLRLTFSDGTVRDVDFHDYLRDAPRPWITKYWDLEEFKNFSLTDGDLMWGDFDLIFPISDLYKGTIEYDFSRKSEIPEEAKRREKQEQVAIPVSTLHRLESRAKKENVPVELLAQRYIEEGVQRHV